jgi:2-haloalkanoic acid dehalogenase type II
VTAPIRAVIFDAYGTLIRAEDLALIPQRICADHGLAVPSTEVLKAWVALYHEATLWTPFQTLRQIETEILARVLRQFGCAGDPAPYVELFFAVTTRIELYPEVLDVLHALRHVRTAVLSNADQEHVDAWTFTLPVEFVLSSEALGAYKPHPLAFQHALDRLGLGPHEVLHVGDSELDDVRGAKSAGLRVAWINRDGRSLRRDVPRPDFEFRDLRGLLDVV